MTDTALHHEIVVGVDGSDSALRAVTWAAREADLRHVRLRLLNICHTPPVEPHSPVSLPRRYADALAEYGREYLRAASAEALHATAGLDVTVEQRHGHAAAELIAAAKTARLVVLGSRGLGGFSSLLVGSTAIAVSAHAACPVVVVPNHTEPENVAPTRSVAVGVDGTPLSDAALEFGFDAAAARGVPLVAIHIWNGAMTQPGWPELPMTITDAETAENRLFAERLAGWAEKYPDVEIDRRVRKGRRARCLLLEARFAQLIVVGTRGQGALAGLGLGSVSQKILHRAHCPVALVRGSQASE